LFCDHCGLQFFPGQSLCSRCHVTSTRHCFQLMSLATLLIAAACNSLAFLLLPLLAGHPARLGLAPARSHAPTLKISAIHTWLWVDGKASLYGWAPLALSLLAWDYFAWPESRPTLTERIKRWAVRALLIFAFVAESFPFFPRWIRPPAALLVTAAKLPRFPVSFPPGLSAAVPWAMVGFAAALLCINADTRDSLLGHGRVLSAVSLGVLLTVLTLTLLAFVP